MGFGISTRDTLVIRSFAQAEYLFSKVKEIRSTNKFTVGVPLQHNRRDWRHKALVRIDNNTYAAKLYDTNVVTWHRDGRIDVDMTYRSQSTNTFANYFLWSSIGNLSISSEKRVVTGHADAFSQPMRLRVLEDGGKLTDWCHFAVDGRVVTFTKSEDGTHVSPLATAYKNYVDKSKATELRKKYAPMMEYLKMFEAYQMDTFEEVLDEWAREQKLGSAYAARSKIIDAVIADPDNDTLWGVLAAAFHDNSYGWNNGSYGHRLRFGGVKAIKNTIYPAAYRRAGIYEAKPLPFGTLVDGWTRSI
jgi:hypothetical protein